MPGTTQERLCPPKKGTGILFAMGNGRQHRTGSKSNWIVCEILLWLSNIEHQVQTRKIILVASGPVSSQPKGECS
jgi:hypothetical protein